MGAIVKGRTGITTSYAADLLLWQVPTSELAAHLEKFPRRTDWIQLWSGRKFYPLEPHPMDVFIEDIAHNLSMMCRFGGAIREPYSVAEHCVRASWIVPVEDALDTLLHEGDECWGMPDLTRPVKHHPAFKALWDFYGGQQQAAVNVRFGLRMEKPDSVKHADDVMLLTEQRDLQGPQVEPWTMWAKGVKPLSMTIEPWTQREAEMKFLQRFYELGGKYADPS